MLLNRYYNMSAIYVLDYQGAPCIISNIPMSFPIWQVHSAESDKLFKWMIDFCLKDGLIKLNGKHDVLDFELMRAHISKHGVDISIKHE